MQAGKLIKADILFLLQELDRHLNEDEGPADMYIYGGAGLVLSREFRKTASDIDAYMPETDIIDLIIQARWGLGARHGLNGFADPHEDIGLYQPWLDLNNMRLDAMVKNPSDYFDSVSIERIKALRIHIAKPHTQLALKLLRETPMPKDHDDIAHLCHETGVRNGQDLADIWHRHAPLLPADVRESFSPQTLGLRWSVIKARMTTLHL